MPHVTERPGETLDDMYRAFKGKEGRSLYSLDGSDVTVKYNKNYNDDLILNRLKEGTQTLDVQEASIFKKMIANDNMKNPQLVDLAGYDLITEERGRVSKDIEQLEHKIATVAKGPAPGESPINPETNQKKPVVNKTKVERATDTFQADTMTKNHTPKKSPTGPHVPKPKVGAIGMNTPSAKTVSSLLKGKRGAIALGSLGIGLASAALDDESDDTISTVAKGVKTAAIGSGLGYAGEQMFKTQTVQDLIQGEVSDISKSIRKKGMADKKIMAAGSKLPTLMKVGAAIIGAATVVDVASTVSDRRVEKKMSEMSEKQISDKDRRRDKKNREFSHETINDGEILFDMFNRRTGHHKMGNSRF